MVKKKRQPRLLAVVGPTGSGKTAGAVALAKKFNGVLISADSRQVYRGLAVGTNKEGGLGRWHDHPARFIEGIPQLLLDVVEPGEPFSLHDWLTAARYLIKEIWAHGQLPIIVGGTGLYVTALLEGYEPGWGRYAKNRQPVEFSALILQLNRPREMLYQKSDHRFEAIFDDLVAETKQLLQAGVSRRWLEKIGLDYRFASYFIHLRLNRQLAIEQYQQASRQYIRRQLTWWRHHGPVELVADQFAATSRVAAWLNLPSKALE